MNALEKPAPVGWCEEHERYFYWHGGCRADVVPSAPAIRAWYAWAFRRVPPLPARRAP